MSVLLSHVKEDADVASVLVQWIESSLDRDVLVSGEPQSIRLDDQQLAQVDHALNEARVVVLLGSEQSIRRPWIGFEAGCAWFKRVPVVVVCHSGCVASDLPPLLASFPAFSLDDPASCQDLLETLAAHLSRQRLPRVNLTMMVDEIRTAASPVAPAKTTEPIELRLLSTIKRYPEFTFTAPALAEELDEPERTVRSALESLAVNHLLMLTASTHPTDPETRYAIADKGRAYLARHGP